MTDELKVTLILITCICICLEIESQTGVLWYFKGSHMTHFNTNVLPFGLLQCFFRLRQMVATLWGVQ